MGDKKDIIKALLGRDIYAKMRNKICIKIIEINNGVKL
jgi:hypothetical protein